MSNQIESLGTLRSIDARPLISPNDLLPLDINNDRWGKFVWNPASRLFGGKEGVVFQLFWFLTRPEGAFDIVSFQSNKIITRLAVKPSTDKDNPYNGLAASYFVEKEADYFGVLRPANSNCLLVASQVANPAGIAGQLKRGKIPKEISALLWPEGFDNKHLIIGVEVDFDPKRRIIGYDNYMAADPVYTTSLSVPFDIRGGNRVEVVSSSLDPKCTILAGETARNGRAKEPQEIGFVKFRPDGTTELEDVTEEQWREIMSSISMLSDFGLSAGAKTTVIYHGRAVFNFIKTGSYTSRS